MSGMVVCEISQKMHIICFIFYKFKNSYATANYLNIQNYWMHNSYRILVKIPDNTRQWEPFLNKGSLTI